MRTGRLRYGMLVLAMCVVGAADAVAATADAPRITKEEAKALLDVQQVVFVDARTESTWSRSDKKIRGAVRVDKWDLEMWASPYPSNTTFIVY